MGLLDQPWRCRRPHAIAIPPAVFPKRSGSSVFGSEHGDIRGGDFKIISFEHRTQRIGTVFPDHRKAPSMNGRDDVRVKV